MASSKSSSTLVPRDLIAQAREMNFFTVLTVGIGDVVASRLLSEREVKTIALSARLLRVDTLGQWLGTSQLPARWAQLAPDLPLEQTLGVLARWLREEAPSEILRIREKLAIRTLTDEPSQAAHAKKEPAAAPDVLPETPEGLEAWARERGVEDVLDAPLSRTIALPGYTHFIGFYGIDPKVTLLAVFHPSPSARAVHRSLPQQWHERVRSAAEVLLRMTAAEVAEQRARRAALEARAAEPTHPALSGLLAWLRAGKASIAGSASPALAGTVASEGVYFRQTSLSLVYRERNVLTLRVDEVEIGLGVWQTEPFSTRDGAPASPALVRAVDAAIDSLRDPQDPMLAQLIAWLASPAWRSLLDRFDAATGALAVEEAEQRLAFRVSGEGAQISIEPLVQRPSMRGGWTPGHTSTPEKLLALGEDWIDELEEQVLLMLTDSTGSFRRDEDQRRSLLVAALEQLARHPRVFLAARPDVQVRIVREKIRVELSEAEGGVVPRLFAGKKMLRPSWLKGVLDRRGRAVLIDLDAARITLLHLDAQARRVVSVLAQQSAVFPDEGQGELVERIARMQGSLDVGIPPLLAGHEIEPDMRLRVQLEAQPVGLSLALRSKPIAEGAAFVPGSGPLTAVGERGGARIHARRRLKDERASAVSLLDKLALPEALGAEQDEQFERAISDDEAAVALIELLGPMADAGEIVLEQPEGGPRIVGNADVSAMRLRIDRDHGWFEVKGGVEIDGELMKLAELLLAARHGKRFVDMGQRRFIRLSRELRERLLVVDGALFQGKKSLEIGEIAAPALSLLVEQPEQITGDKAFAELRAKVEKADQKEPKLPRALKASLRPYQREGFAWLMRLASWGTGACLADEMGLGKTLQTIAVMLARGGDGPQLVVAPTSVGPNWMSELQRFAPRLRAVLFRGSSREKLLDSLGPRDVLVTSYDIVARDEDALAKVQFTTLVLDEAQALKNAATRRARAVAALQADFKIALTGTPVENHLGDLWSIFRLVAPGLLGSWEHFSQRFATPVARDGDIQRRQALARLIKPFLLRRTKAQVAPDLPERVELVRFVETSPAERALYEVARKQALAALAGIDETQDARFLVLAELTRLRRLACNPRLIDPASPVASSKLATFLSLWDELLEEGHKALVFSQFTSHLALVREALESQKQPYLYLDGSTPLAERARLVEAYQRGDCPLFLISLKAGGTGLNLTAADTVIHLDPWWNPAVEDQASDRAHRIGQARVVTVIRLICQGTIEEAVVALHAEKRELAEGLLTGADSVGKLSTAQLTSLVMTGGSSRS